jgi:hypothetical protein
MAKPNPKQQSSQLKKLLLIGGGLVVIVIVAFPSGGPDPTTVKKVNPVVQTSSTKKQQESLYTEEDKNIKFASVNGTIKNGFVPLVTKGQGKKALAGGIDGVYTNGEGSWTYTGNMVVNGVPNALLENGSSGDGVFLRPGQHWKSMRLIAVKEDSIEIEGPNGARKTVYFADKNVSMVANSASSSNLTPLPPASIQGNLPSGANPQLSQPNGNPRRQRGQQANQADTNAMIGPIGAQSDLTSSLDGYDPTNNSNTTGNNRRIRRNQ